MTEKVYIKVKKIKINKIFIYLSNINLWINNYGNNFVNVLRERWGMGNCGEDIVILFVQIPPVIIFFKLFKNFFFNLRSEICWKMLFLVGHSFQRTFYQLTLSSLLSTLLNVIVLHGNNNKEALHWREV